MIRIILLLLVFLSLAYAASAQFDPASTKKSVVRVVVSINDRESNVCTGFVWKTPGQVVTSLHSMSRTGTIKVLFLNQYWREARIKKVLQKADLVLLEVIPGQDPLPSGIVPLTSFNEQPIQFGTEIYAMGYNSGATGSSSRTLKKGFVDPETLDNLIPRNDKLALARIGFPALDLHILYLEGSLLPGYSGSPVFDPAGRLIGIGDGGLERGASNVSWIIPAKYLRELENSTTSSLPANFEDLTQLFSARSVVESTAENIDEVWDDVFDEGSDYWSEGYGNFTALGFDFYQTKNRSLIEMVDTSDDPENLLKFATELEEYNIAMDYEGMRFDIYEDVNHGVVLAVPEGKTLFYDDVNDYFITDFGDNSLVGLFYVGALADNTYADFEMATADVQDWVNTYITQIYGVSNFTTDDEYSYWKEFSGGRKIAWISMSGDDPIYAADGNIYAVGLYLTLLMSDEKTFLAVSSYLFPATLLQFTMAYGIDCINPVYYSECAFLDQWMKSFCAAHLTTFAW